MATDALGVVRFSARNPAPAFVYEKPDAMKIPEFDWKWSDELKDLVPYQKGVVDLQEVTDSYKDQCGVKNILRMVAQGDMSMIKPGVNLGDITIYPDNIHDAKAADDAAKQAAAALDGLGLVDKDGNKISGVALSQKETQEIQEIVKAYLAGKEEGVKENGSEK